MTEETKQMVEHQTSFLKQAFCIDGQCSMYARVDLNEMKSIMYELIDSKRGTFYVTLSKK